jgi:hypothetical protein
MIGKIYSFLHRMKRMTYFSVPNFRIFLITALAGLCMHGTPMAQEAAPAPIVIETFTTANCEACVFNERMLYEAMADESIIGLSCFIADASEVVVDEASNKPQDEKTVPGPMDPCVFRQWTYEVDRHLRTTTIKIPFMIVNGSEDIAPGDARALKAKISFLKNNRNSVQRVSMEWRDADTIAFSLPDAREDRNWPSASLWLIRYQDSQITKMESGVNAGRVLRFSNIVQDIRHIGKWHGRARSYELDVAKPPGGDKKGGYVIIVQEMMGEPILAAGKLKDYTEGAGRISDPSGRAEPVPLRAAP